MSKIDELIVELCPEGVEYRELQEIFDIRNGYTPSKANSAFWANGTIPWFRMEDIRKNGRILGDSIQKITPEAVKNGKLFPANSLIIATTATIGEHALLTADSLANQQFTFLTRKVNCLDLLDPKFIFYYGFVLSEWCRNNTNVSSFASVDMAKFRQFKFPIPPLEVQRAIVEVLDSFTELEAELETELEARKKQYEFYRNQLLTFDDAGVRWTTLGELLDYEQPGKYIVKSTEYDDSYVTPVLTAGQSFVLGYTDEKEGIYNASKDRPVMIFDDFTTSNHWVDFDFKVKSSAMKMLRMKKDTDVSFRYVYHFIKTILYAPQDHARQWIANYSRFSIPVPLIEEQNRIVSILDNFDKLTTNISEGLPAEINARRKQYEYYRSKLLTFDEKKEPAHV